MNHKLILISCFFFLNSYILAQNKSLDVRLLETINHNYSKTGDKFFKTTDYTFYPTLVLLPVTFLGYGRWKNYSYATNTGYLLFASEAISGSVILILKYTFRRKRPYETIPNVRTVKREPTPAFPSGHAGFSWNMATILALRYPSQKVIIPAFLWAGLISYGRVYLGVHYPLDVLSGAAIGVGSAYLTYHHQDKIIFEFKRMNGFSEALPMISFCFKF